MSCRHFALIPCLILNTTLSIEREKYFWQNELWLLSLEHKDKFLSACIWWYYMCGTYDRGSISNRCYLILEDISVHCHPSSHDDVNRRGIHYLICLLISAHLFSHIVLQVTISLSQLMWKPWTRLSLIGIGLSVEIYISAL